MNRMKDQAIRWGAELVTEDVTAVDLSQRPFVIRSEEREIYAHSVVIATGATAKRMGLPSEALYWSRGISACAICDGATPLFKGVELAIVGGGDTAAEEGIFLTKYASHVHMLVRREVMRASKAMQDRVLSNPNITVHWNTEAVDVLGEGGQLVGMRLRDTKTGEERELPVRGLFYAIGHTPNTQLFQGQLALDVGYIITQHGSPETSVEGVFAAGDVQDHEYRQAVTAAGSGCMAALLAERWLSAKGLLQEFRQLMAEPVAADVVDSEASERLESEAEEPSDVDSGLAGDDSQGIDLDMTRHVGGYALRKLYHESDRLMMVKYASPTCGPCHTLKPILSKVVDEFDGKIHYIEIDIEDDPDIAESAGIVGTPTVQFFRNKDMVGEMRGVKQKSQYRQMIEQNL